MVKAGWGASRLKVDTTLVELERGVGSINSNGDGANSGNSIHQSILVTLGNILEGRDGSSNISGGEVADTVLGSVGVRGLSVKTLVGNDIFEGIIHQTPLHPLFP